MASKRHRVQIDADILTTRQAMDATDSVVRAALDARRYLLDVGWDVEHELPQSLDAIAREWSVIREAQTRRLLELQRELDGG